MAKSKKLKAAIRAVKKAGSFLQSIHGQRQAFIYKKTSPKLSKDTRKGFQTKADIKAEKIIFQSLRKAFPNDGILSEEGRSIGVDRDYIWVVDPLEGTIAYIHGLETYGVALALLYKKEIVLGVVYCPVVSYLFWAEKGKGAFLNGQPIKISDTEKVKDALISLEHKIFRLGKTYPRVVKDLVKKIRRLRVGESCGQELCFVAAGKTDALIKARQPLYDYAAGKIILEEAGGIFTNFKGEEISVDLDPEVGVDFVASNGKIHGELLKYLQGE